jgi:hypothetical protein
MRIKVLLNVFLAMMLLVLGCRTNKASEQQSAANQQAATPAPSNDTAAQPSQSPEDVQKPAPKPKLRPRSEATPPSSVPESSPVSTPPDTPTPTPTPVPRPIVLPAGTALSIRTTGPLGSNTSQANQEFEASLAKPLLSGNEVVVPMGAPVKGVILKAESAGRIKGEGGLTLQLTSLTLKGKPYRIATNHVMQQAKGRGKRSAAMIGGGGGAGAVIGGIAGGGKGAAIGALAGAAAGTAGATMTGKRDVVIPAETVLNFKLSAPLTLPPRQGGPSPEGASGTPETSPPARPEKGTQPPPSQPPR